MVNNRSPPPYAPVDPSRLGPGGSAWRPPNHRHYASTDNTPLNGGYRQPKNGLLSSCLIFFCIICMTISFFVAVYSQNQLNDALTPAHIRLRNRQWAKEEKDHQDVKSHYASEELRLKKDYERTELEWSQKIKGLRKEHDRLKDIWTQEQERYRQDQDRWEKERQAEEKRRKENERKRLGINWGFAYEQPCSAYGTRPYIAKLMNIPPGFDGIEACEEMPIVFHGRTIEKPQWCEKLWEGEIHGHWTIDFDEPLCQPPWEELKDLGCAGYGSGLRRWGAHMAGSGREYLNICSNAPMTIWGWHFETPTHCEDRGQWGTVGLWDRPDSTCE